MEKIMENSIYEKTMLCLALSLLSIRLANYMLLLDKNLPLTSSTTWTLGYTHSSPPDIDRVVVYFQPCGYKTELHICYTAQRSCDKSGTG